MSSGLSQRGEANATERQALLRLRAARFTRRARGLPYNALRNTIAGENERAGMQFRRPPRRQKMARVNAHCREVGSRTLDRVIQFSGAMAFANEMQLFEAYVSMRHVIAKKGLEGDREQSAGRSVESFKSNLGIR